MALLLVRSRGSAETGFLFGPFMLAWFALLGIAGAERTSFFVTRALSVPSRRRGLAPWRERPFASLSHDAGGASDRFRLPPAQAVEIGSQAES